MALAGFSWTLSGYIYISTGIVTLACCILLSLRHRNSQKSRFPPGPFSLPIVGTLPFLGRDIRVGLKRLSQRYGPVVTVYLGSRRVVILNSYDAIKEAFVTHGSSTCGRPQDLIWIKEFTKGMGVISTQGEVWHEQRRFIQSVFRELEMGHMSVEKRVQNEARYLTQGFYGHTDTPMDPHHVIQRASANGIYSFIFGNRMDYDDVDYIRILQQVEELLENVGNVGLLSALPFLRFLPGDPIRFKRLNTISAQVRETIRHEVGKRKQNTGSGPHCYIDAYLKTIKEGEKNDTPSSFSEEQMIRVIVDLISSGLETVTFTLLWGIVHLVRNTVVQDRIQKEIDDVIGHARAPELVDRLSMPYTVASLDEIQRIADVLPLGGPRCTSEQVQVAGYDLPVGTELMANLYSVHYDETLWPNPGNFDPNRFLDQEGKSKRGLIPFSLGKRGCLGEQLARTELFIFFTSMLQAVTFRTPEGEPVPSTEGDLGIAFRPKSFRVCVTKRS